MITGFIGIVLCIIAIMAIVAVMKFVFELLGNGGGISVVIVILIVGFLLFRFGIL